VFDRNKRNFWLAPSGSRFSVYEVSIAVKHLNQVGIPFIVDGLQPQLLQLKSNMIDGNLAGKP
jgi:hypothetical protein